MRVWPHLFTGALLAALGVALAAQSQPPRPTAPAGAPVPGIAQPPPRPQPSAATQATGTGIIRGRVVRADTGRPLAKTRVSVTLPGPRETLTATTDADGRYELKGLPASRYVPRAFREGFGEASYGQKRPFAPSKEIVLADGQTLERIDFALIPGGVITGQVFDDAGEPMARAWVQAIDVLNNGQRSAQDVTDDLGRFRLFGLAPATYIVSATDPGLQPPSGGLPAGSALVTYYPGTRTAAEAKRIRVDAGAEVTDLSIAMASVRVATLAGVVRTATGGVPPMNLMLSVRPVRSGGSGTGGTILRADGTFAIQNLPPDRYVVLARDNSQMALTEVTLDGADVSVALTLGAGDTARGRIVFDTGAPPAGLQPASLLLRAEPSDTGLFIPPARPRTVLRDDWTFEIPGLVGQWWLGIAPMPPGWAVSSIRVDDRDITDEALDFTGKDINGIVVQLTERLTTVSGQVSDGRGQATADAVVLIFPEDTEKWKRGWRGGSRFIRRVAVDSDGRFTVRGLPPARYLAVAMDFLQPGVESDADMLDELRRFGTRFTLADAESATLNLKVTAAP
jgi:hypothetical protein